VRIFKTLKSIRLLSSGDTAGVVIVKSSARRRKEDNDLRDIIIGPAKRIRGLFIIRLPPGQEKDKKILIPLNVKSP